MIDIILIEPRKQTNVGSVARAMANLNFSQLILINPKCKIGITAKKVAKHGQHILKKIKTAKDFSYLKKYDYRIGTTAILGTDYNIPRNPISAEKLGKKLATINQKKAKIALIIGRETIGLTNEEINQCNILASIPSSKKYPTLNISHATAILLYEIFKAKQEHSLSHVKPASKVELGVIDKHLAKILDSIEFSTKEKKTTQKRVWKRVFGKALLTKREAFVVMGLLRKLQGKKKV